jgi:hypothetical protein
VRVAIPDLYRSKIAYEAAEAEHLMGGLDWGAAVEGVFFFLTQKAVLLIEIFSFLVLRMVVSLYLVCVWCVCRVVCV